MIIKCPECGKQVSDKAPTCPTCGVQIAGKVCQCQNCGEVYFNDQDLCPACHQINSNPQKPYRAATPVQPVPAAPVPRPAQSSPRPAAGNGQAANGQAATDPNAPQPKKGGNTATIIAAVFFALIICGGLYYLYYGKDSAGKEDEAYELAMRAGQQGDEKSLQEFLAQFPDATPEHVDSVKALLNLLMKKDQDWTNAYLSRSQTALQKYIDDNPDSPHVREAKNLIDTIAWQAAEQANTIESVERYIADHPDGGFMDEAKAVIEKLKSNTVSDEDKQKVVGAVRRFFQSVNSRNEAGMINAVSPNMDKFLDKANPTQDDIRSFLQRNYKEGVTNVNWHIDASTYDIKKRQVDEGEYVFDATVNAARDTESGEIKSIDTFVISVTIGVDGTITSMTLKK